MTVEQFNKKQSEMSDKELLEKTTELLSKLCKTGGKSLLMSVPQNVNDFDMLVCELMKRYKNKVINNQLEQDFIKNCAHDDWTNYCNTDGSYSHKECNICGENLD